MDIGDSIYPGAFYRLLQRFERKQRPYKNIEAILPPEDADLLSLRETVVAAPDAPKELDDDQDAARKYQSLLAEFDGRSQLWVVHAMCIAILRRRNPPEAARRLFFRIWREMGDDLARDLPVRWLISAATTFADQGETAAQRAGGMGLSVLFDSIKLHDSERRISGWRNDMAFPRQTGGLRHDLAFDMDGYSLIRGDLDRNMLARLWLLAEGDVTLRPLGIRMLRMLASDRRTVFARVQQYRGDNPAAEDPEITWGVCATVAGATGDILRFTAHHLELGAHRIHIYLDDPDSDAYDFLKAHPKIRVIRCDRKHWQKTGYGRPARHQVRQSFNATHAYHVTDTTWLCHIDLDEFLWAEKPVLTSLRALPGDVHCARMRPLEALAGDGSEFKIAIPPGPERDKITARLFPTHGHMVRGGFVSHLAGKLFARTGLQHIDFRIHRFFASGGEELKAAELDRIDLCHKQSETWEDWIRKLGTRLETGSLRSEIPAPDPARMSVHDYIRSLEKDHGEAGLRSFYDEIFAADPAVRDRLRQRGITRLRTLDLQTKLKKHFPEFSDTVV